MKNIDPTKPLTQEDFCELFEQVPLNEQERADVKEIYWGIYSICLEHPDISETDAWLATKNTFMAKETQIKERMNNHLKIVK